MSASGYKQTYSGQRANVRFAPESGPNWTLRGMSAFDPNRSLAFLYRDNSYAGRLIKIKN